MFAGLKIYDDHLSVFQSKQLLRMKYYITSEGIGQNRFINEFPSSFNFESFRSARTSLRVPVRRSNSQKNPFHMDMDIKYDLYMSPTPLSHIQVADLSRPIWSNDKISANYTFRDS